MSRVECRGSNNRAEGFSKPDPVQRVAHNPTSLRNILSACAEGCSKPATVQRVAHNPTSLRNVLSACAEGLSKPDPVQRVAHNPTSLRNVLSACAEGFSKPDSSVLCILRNPILGNNYSFTNLSTAFSSVSSFFAKQKRTTPLSIAS